MSGIKKHLSLISPVLVFDAGIGSYDIAERIHHAFPQQDVLYLADREAFPFGSKSTEELLRVISATLEYGKTQYGVNTVVLASNTPSIDFRSIAATTPRYDNYGSISAYSTSPRALTEQADWCIRNRWHVSE